MDEPATLRTYHFEPQVTTLGPGLRAGLWVQGCDFACPGCIVPDSHNHTAGEVVDITTMADRLIQLPGSIEGVTLSGGEPFLQARALASLITQVKRHRPSFSVMIFTGFKIEALRHCADKKRLLDLTDILVDGRFVQSMQVDDVWRGSSNQRIFFLTTRYSPDVYLNACPNALEFIVQPGGGYFMAGIPSRDSLTRIDQNLQKIGHVSSGDRQWQNNKS